VQLSIVTMQTVLKSTVLLMDHATISGIRHGAKSILATSDFWNHSMVMVWTKDIILFLMWLPAYKYTQICNHKY